MKRDISISRDVLLDVMDNHSVLSSEATLNNHVKGITYDEKTKEFKLSQKELETLAGKISLSIQSYQKQGKVNALRRAIIDLGDQTKQLSAMISGGDLYYDRTLFNDAAKKYEKALSLAQDLGDKEKEAEALRKLAKVEVASSKTNKIPKSWDTAFEISKDLEDKYQFARVLILEIYIRWKLGEKDNQIDDAANHAKGIIDRTLTAGNQKNASAWYHLHYGNYQLGKDLKEALKHHKLSLEFFSQLIAKNQKLEGQAKAHNNIGVVYSNYEDDNSKLNKAVEHYTQSIKLREGFKLRYEVQIADTQANLIDVLSYLKDSSTYGSHWFKECTQFYIKALSVFEKYDYKRGLGNLHKCASAMHAQRALELLADDEPNQREAGKRWADAQEHYHTAIALFKEVKHTYLLKETESDFAKVSKQIEPKLST